MDEKVNRREMFRKFVADRVNDMSRWFTPPRPEDSSPLAQMPASLSCDDAAAMLCSSKTKKQWRLHSNLSQQIPDTGDKQNTNTDSPATGCARTLK